MLALVSILLCSADKKANHAIVMCVRKVHFKTLTEQTVIKCVQYMKNIQRTVTKRAHICVLGPSKGHSKVR